jgi:hypothetical protein
MNLKASLLLRGVPVVTSLLGLLVGVSTACSSAPTVEVATSPTPDMVTRNYVALARNYWIQILAADQVSNGSNLAARVCLGKTSATAPSKLALVDAPMCRERAVAILAVQQKFLNDLDTTPPPTKFAADDRAVRGQLPHAIADVKAIISAADTGSKDAVLQASIVYIDDMIPIVTSALDDIDPSVAHI